MFTRHGVSVNPKRRWKVESYSSSVPKLWSETIEAHKREVHTAILETTAALVEHHGPTTVTMSQIAEEAGIGRATLYKYFPSVEAILLAWHDRHVADHLAQLEAARDRASNPDERLRCVLEAYAAISHEHPSSELAALLHRGAHMARAEHQLHRFVRDLLAEGANTGCVRDDVPTDELARYCIHALGAAGAVRSRAAVRRLVELTLAGLRPDGGPEH